MSIFSKILDKLGIKKDKKEEDAEQAKVLADMARKEAEARAKMQTGTGNPATSTTAAKPSVAGPQTTAGPARPSTPGSSPSVVAGAPGTPKAISEVDVVHKLETLGQGKGLNWKVSIVDLLKLLDLDSSREARNELAKELGCPEELMQDSAKMNVWLHKTVLKKIAENGGNIPAELLD